MFPDPCCPKTCGSGSGTLVSDPYIVHNYTVIQRYLLAIVDGEHCVGQVHDRPVRHGGGDIFEVLLVVVVITEEPEIKINNSPRSNKHWVIDPQSVLFWIRLFLSEK